MKTKAILVATPMIVALFAVFIPAAGAQLVCQGGIVCPSTPTPCLSGNGPDEPTPGDFCDQCAGQYTIYQSGGGSVKIYCGALMAECDYNNCMKTTDPSTMGPYDCQLNGNAASYCHEPPSLAIVKGRILNTP